MERPVKIAIVQQSAAFLDIESSIALAAEIIAEAASKGTNLIVFGECWLTGYPVWIDHARDFARWDLEVTRRLFQRMHCNSVTVNSPEIEAICAASKEHAVCICIGINELEHKTSGTIYNSALIIDQGEIILHHRKLMPTFTEKLVYGIGDGRGLGAAESSVGRIGVLICWEHWMPLARQAMHNSDEEIHIALWPNVHEKLQIASRHYAFEGRTFVVAAGQVMSTSELPDELEYHIDTPEYVLNGLSAVIDPRGDYILDPQNKDVRIAYSTIPDISTRYSEKMTLDVSGHYARPDIFDFSVKR